MRSMVERDMNVKLKDALFVFPPWLVATVILFAIAGAVLTPGDLVVGQLMMTGSMTVLYNLSILIAWLVQRKRKTLDPPDAEEAPESSTEIAPLP